MHEYAKLQGAKADVKWEGDRLQVILTLTLTLP